MIKHFSHKEINKARWDRCIEQCINGLPYAYTWWLDIVSPGWEALIKGDYESVMPLTRRKKFGIEYLFQPYFTQQLGVFSNHFPDTEETDAFLDVIPSKYKYIDIHLNKSVFAKHKDYIIQQSVDHIIKLDLSYDQLKKGYHRNCQRNILKAEHAGLMVKPCLNAQMFSEFIEYNLKNILKNKHKSFPSLLSIIADKSLKMGKGKILGIYDQNEEMNAAAWFLKDLGYCFFLVCASTNEGSNNHAMYYLVDHVIKENAGSGILFDFTGSNIPGISYFNTGFGAVKNSYQTVKRNSLPWPIKLFKR